MDELSICITYLNELTYFYHQINMIVKIQSYYQNDNTIICIFKPNQLNLKLPNGFKLYKASFNGKLWRFFAKDKFRHEHEVMGRVNYNPTY